MKDLNVESVKSVLERIRSVNSKNKKAEILKEFQDNKIVRETLRFLLNDFVVTGLAMKKIEKEIGVEPNFSINTLQEAFSYLKKNNTGRFCCRSLCWNGFVLVVTTYHSDTDS